MLLLRPSVGDLVLAATPFVGFLAVGTRVLSYEKLPSRCEFGKIRVCGKESLHKVLHE